MSEDTATTGMLAAVTRIATSLHGRYAEMEEWAPRGERVCRTLGGVGQRLCILKRMPTPACASAQRLCTASGEGVWLGVGRWILHGISLAMFALF